MNGSPHPQEVLDAIVMLAQQIARAAPECAEQAMQIADLAASLRPKTDWAVVKALGDKGPNGR